MQEPEPIEASYFAKAPVEVSDIYLDFYDLVVKRAFFPELITFSDGIIDDLHNLGASLEKLDLFYRWSQKETTGVSQRFVSTELEYVFSVCRSIFDLLQEWIALLWRRLKFFDERKQKKPLPQSFRKMVLHGAELLSSEAIAEKRQIPLQLAEFYHRQGEFFQWLREYRGCIIHSGKSFEFIFVTERGFAIFTDRLPFSSLDIWTDENTLSNNLGSVRSAVSYVVFETLKALEDFAATAKILIPFPDDIAPDYKVFIRGKHTARLLEARDYIENQAWYN